MPDVLITGASGFVGRQLTARLREEKHQVTELTRALGDIADANT
ncbi:MAG: NAD-dependent epimerase/dehydratase family protein, partial [Sediminibacterium sp.]